MAFIQVTGNTPLMYAAMENKLPLVKQMVMLGCNINSVNNEGYTALHLGSMYAKEALVTFLLAKEADPTITGGVSVLQYHFDAFSHHICFEIVHVMSISASIRYQKS